MILKANHSNARPKVAATLVEVAMIVGVSLLVAAAVFVVITRSKQRSSPVTCTNCMKQIGLAFRTWELDNSDKFPMHVSVTNGGTMEIGAKGNVFPHFVVMSNELSTPIILVCPADNARSYVTDFSKLTDAHLSYFINLDSTESDPRSVLSGDRNLTNQRPAGALFINIDKTTTLGWTKALHVEQGNLLFSDGSVNGFRNGFTGGSLGVSDGVTNRLVTP
jgi:hypothetical protein